MRQSVSLLRRSALVASAALLAAPLTVLAHHSFAMYDHTRTVTLKGELIETWEQPDPTTQVLHARKNANFHFGTAQGRAWDANDIKFNIERSAGKPARLPRGRRTGTAGVRAAVGYAGGGPRRLGSPGRRCPGSPERKGAGLRGGPPTRPVGRPPSIPAAA